MIRARYEVAAEAVGVLLSDQPSCDVPDDVIRWYTSDPKNRSQTGVLSVRTCNVNKQYESE